MTKQEFMVAVADCTAAAGYSNPFVVLEAFGNIYVLNKKEAAKVRHYQEFNEAAYLYIDMEREYNLVINERCYLLFKVVRTPLMKVVFDFAATPPELRRGGTWCGY